MLALHLSVDCYVFGCDLRLENVLNLLDDTDDVKRSIFQTEFAHLEHSKIKQVLNK